MNDERRTAPRIPVPAPIAVTDSITGEIIGRMGNLSRNGMMLICQQPLRDGALYQVRFRLDGSSEEIETGLHTMWTEQASTGGQQWSGMRIISISAPDADLLDKWLDRVAA
ncbi:MAG TPA: PilZ domain-containing protein [Rhodanobacteraceae bacterium]|jgi:hypothetical protein|nr:PilZ domain-containing protein [Rhodanobacteraceae bacterium]